MPKIKVSDTTVNFHVQGDGQGLVLVHGTGAGWKDNWSHLVDRFSDNYKVVCPEYSGSGQTQDNGEELSLELLAEQVIAAAKAADVIPFSIVGLSLGATLSAYIASKYPQYVSSVVLVAGFASTSDSRSQLQFELWRELIQKDKRTLAKIILLTCFSPSYIALMTSEQIDVIIGDVVKNSNWEGMDRQVILDLSINIDSIINKINMPALIIACNNDYIIPIERSRELAKLIPHSEYVELSSGHMVVHEQPELLVDHILDFLSKNKK